VGLGQGGFEFVYIQAEGGSIQPVFTDSIRMKSEMD
jgi:hypothetical protein